ncbi:MAG: response regulator [Chloroflexi bacterium]|nr:MAG: response regulator [Chloroflexota bacterium]
MVRGECRPGRSRERGPRTMSSMGRALIVDDSRVNRLVLARLLASLGLTSVEADNGRSALERLRDEDQPDIDVVLLDILMPEMDGYETLAEIKADPALRSVPVIVISGVEELESAVRCIEMGAADYLTKPFNPAILGARINASLSAKRLRDLELEYLDRQSATNEVLRAISRSAFDLDTLLTSVIDTAGRLCRAEYAVIYLADGNLFYPAATARASAELVDFFRTNPISVDRHSLVGRVALTGNAVAIPDVLADPEYRTSEAQSIGGWRSLLGVPILKDGQVIGVMSAARNEVRPFSESETLLVTAFAEQAAIGIENARLVQTIERQKQALSRFLSPQVAALVSTAEGEQLLAGHRRQITAVFCDLRGFTAFAETAEPEELFGVLGDYHRSMGALIVENGGTLEHFAGDGMMVFFNDPIPQDDHVERAVRMTVAMRERFGELSGSWRKRGYELEFGVGVAVGYATLGRIGFEGRYDYGAIGNAVILASRLSSEARPNQILLSQRAFAAVEDLVDAEAVGELTLKGFSRAVPAVNVLGLKAAESRDRAEHEALDAMVHP